MAQYNPTTFTRKWLMQNEQRQPYKFRIKAELSELETTPYGKYICPLCGQRGTGSFWWELHRVKPHVECSCGQVVLYNGLKRHRSAKGCTSA